MRRANVVIGRQRVTSAVTGTEADYIRHIRTQVADIKARLDRILTEAEKTTVPAVRAALYPIYKESQRLVPKDTGDLAKSGYLEVVRRKGTVVAEIGYGKYGKPGYTVYVHEILSYEHEAPTQAKFLEAPLRAQMNLILERVGTYIKAHMKK